MSPLAAFKSGQNESLGTLRGGGGGGGRLADSWSEILCVGCWMGGLGKVAGRKDKLFCAARLLLAARPERSSTGRTPGRMNEQLVNPRAA